MCVKFILVLSIGCGLASVALADNDFPAYANPTNFGQWESPIQQMRSGAADQLQATGFQSSAQILRSTVTRPSLPWFNDVVGKPDDHTRNQRVIFFAPTGSMILLGK